MTFIKVIKMIGEKILSTVEFPFKYGDQIAKVIDTGIKDEPALKTAIVNLVHQFEAIEPDALGAIAANGLNVGDDLKAAVDFKSLFASVKEELFPAIEATFRDIKADLAAPPAPAAPAPAPAAAAAQGTGAPA